MSRRFAKEAMELRADIEQFRLASDIAGATQTTGSTDSTGSIESALGRIEDRLVQVHSDTEKLVQRVPENLSLLLAELKEVVLERIDSLKRTSTESIESPGSVRSKDDFRNEFTQKLTPREQNLLRVCFGSGLITYKEVAQHLGITPTSAKNIVNRIFQNTDKRRFFRKTRSGGIARIGVDKTVEKGILGGSQKSSSKGKKIISVSEK